MAGYELPLAHYITMPNDTEIWLNSEMSCAAQILGQKNPGKNHPAHAQLYAQGPYSVFQRTWWFEDLEQLFKAEFQLENNMFPKPGF